MNHTSFSQLLHILYRELEKCGSPLVHNFNHGIDRSEINKLLDPLNLKFPESLVTYFEWKNGRIKKGREDYPLGCFGLFTLASPIPIQLSIDIYKY